MWVSFIAGQAQLFISFLMSIWLDGPSVPQSIENVCLVASKYTVGISLFEGVCLKIIFEYSKIIKLRTRTGNKKCPQWILSKQLETYS